MDGATFVGRPDVGQPRREIRGTLAAKAILRRGDERGVISLVFERLNERSRNDEVSSLGKGWARCDDSYARHDAVWFKMPAPGVTTSVSCAP